MNLQELKQYFKNNISAIYEEAEAENIWRLLTDYFNDRHIVPNEDQIRNVASRLAIHEPIQYILEEAWFYDVPFYVDSNVLIPRPETEELVHWIIKDHQSNDKIAILDIGSGSGCIPITLKRKLPQATVSGCDISPGALAIARKNAMRYNIPIDFIELDFLNEENWDFLPLVDIIVSNPPYIPEVDKLTMHKNVLEYEPASALFVSDADPLIFYEKIAASAKKLLKPRGVIYVETHEVLARNTESLFKNAGAATELKKDLQGKNRLVKAQF